MPRTITVTFEDGTSHVYQNAPDNITPDMVHQRAQAEFGKKVAALDGGNKPSQSAQPEAPYDPTEGMSTTDKVLAGTGRAMVNAARGVGNLLPSWMPGSVSSNDVAEAKKMDAPLMNTTAGKVGDVIGNAAMFAPTAFIPGANTYTGSALIGGIGGALATPGDMSERGKSAAAGAVGGMLGKAAGDTVGMLATKYSNNKLSKLAELANANKVKDATLADAMKAGYVVPPTQANPTILNQTLEGLSGKIKTGQVASIKNQSVSDNLARKALNLAEDVPLTKDTLNAVRSQAGQAYDAVAQSGVIRPTPAYEQALNDIIAPYQKAAQGFPNAKPNPIISEIESLKSPEFDAASAVEKIKVLREDASSAYAKGDKGLGKSLKQAANALEDVIDTHLTSIGAPADLIKGYRDARQLIAKTYSVEGALNDSSGHVIASKLAAQLKRGKPLSGDLKTIAEFANAAPKAAQQIDHSVTQLSPLDWTTGLLSGVASGNPLVAPMSMAVRPAARSAILSKPYQAMMMTPNYAPGIAARNASKLLDNNLQRNALQRLIMGAALTNSEE